MRRQGGFTLIEMVVVIIVTGILAAIALPRFAALQTDARTAKVWAMWGNVQSAMNLARAAGIVNNAGAATAVQMEGGLITMFNFYPASSATGIIRAVQLEGAAAGQNGVTVVVVGATTIDIRVNGAPVTTTCQVRYVRAAAAGALPTVTPTTTGC